jgi:DNA-binding Lrp family transcriptional regulator
MGMNVAKLEPVPSTPRVDETDRRVLAAIQGGLPLVSRPYAAVGARMGLAEAEVIARLARLQEAGVIRRFGVVVRHHEVGYGANAMVVWDVPDDAVTNLGRCLAEFDFITLCYRRPRRLPKWRYNLYCMIHGRDREEVLAHLEWMVNRCGLQDLPHAVLFSRRRFKQRGARYFDVQGCTNPGARGTSDCAAGDVQGCTNPTGGGTHRTAGAAKDARLAPADVEPNDGRT